MANPVIRKQRFFGRGGLGLLFLFMGTAFADAQKILCTANQDLDSEGYGEIRLSGFDKPLEDLSLSFEDWSSFFSIKVQGATRPVLGSYRLEGKNIVFKPRFLPDPQITYVVSFSSEHFVKFFKGFLIDEQLSASIQFSQKLQPTGEVVNVYPSTDELPANVLRLYVELSQPMSFDNPHDFIKVLDETGNEIVEPFVEIEEGLWNTDRTRLTLLFHPGRIKRGVGPNMTIGEILTPGKTVTLSIDQEWKTSAGIGLKKSYSQTFKISDQIRETIPIDRWEIQKPKADSKEVLAVSTHRLLDKALAERMIWLTNGEGNKVKGSMTFNSIKKALTFVPESNWEKGNYQLLVDPKLEDVCGNTPLNVFDLEGSGQKKANGNLSVEFRIQ